MKKFLFLYPIRKYIDRALGPPPNADKVIERLNRIIDIRYRQQGFHIYWLMFSTDGDREMPDLSIVDSRIRIVSQDQIIVCGISRERHRKYIFPSCKLILSKLQPLAELVIGGFHQAQCVNSVARAAYRRGTRVIVDEDTTDQFFKMATISDLPPVIRSRDEYASKFLAILEGMTSFSSQAMVNCAIREHRTERKRKPWLVQI